MKKYDEIEMNQEDLKFIHGDEYEFFEQKIIPNCYCRNCKSSYNSTIVNYIIFLNDLNDIILKGFCEKCKNPIKMQDIKRKNRDKALELFNKSFMLVKKYKGQLI